MGVGNWLGLVLLQRREPGDQHDDHGEYEPAVDEPFPFVVGAVGSHYGTTTQPLLLAIEISMVAVPGFPVTVIVVTPVATAVPRLVKRRFSAVASSFSEATL